MIDVGLACYLLLAHFVADFIFQTSKMGLKKSSSNLILGVHIAIYTTVLWAMMLAYGLPVWFAVLNGMVHWITDYCSSRMGKYYYEQKRMYAFWKVIGLDQLAHTVTLLWTCTWFIQ